MNLSFNKRFVKPIRLCFRTKGKQGKIHSVREDPHNLWMPGKKIHFCTGLRTKFYNRFIKKTPPCVSVQEVIMSTPYGLFNIALVKHKYPYMDIEHTVPIDLKLFAQNDGFNNVSEMADWFRILIKRNNGCYRAKIVHWTNFKY